MPAIPLDVRIRIPKFTVSGDSDDNESYLSASDKDKDIIFEFQCDSIKRELSDGVGAIPLPNFEGALVIALPIVRYIVTLTGRFHEDTHTAHAVSTTVAHIPDFIDIEEMALTWNKAAGRKENGDITAKDRLPELHVDYNRSSANLGTTGDILRGWRVFRGLITGATLMREAGRRSGDFMIQFAVLYEPDDKSNPTESFPALREWA